MSEEKGFLGRCVGSSGFESDGIGREWVGMGGNGWQWVAMGMGSQLSMGSGLLFLVVNVFYAKYSHSGTLAACCSPGKVKLC